MNTSPIIADVLRAMPFGKPMTSRQAADNAGVNVTAATVANGLSHLERAGYLKRSTQGRQQVILWTKVRDLDGAVKPPRPGVRVVRIAGAKSGADNPVRSAISLPAEPWDVECAA